MVSVPDQERPVESTGRWQVSLADLSLLVLAAGLAAGIVRGAREIRVVPVRASGVGVEVAAVFLALILVRSMLGLARRRPWGAGVTMAGRLASMAWRALAVVLLIHFVLMESDVLRIDLATRTVPNLVGKGLGRVVRGEGEVGPDLRDPGDVRDGGGHGGRGGPGTTRAAASATLLVVRPAGCARRRAVLRRAGQLCHRPAVHPGCARGGEQFHASARTVHVGQPLGADASRGDRGRAGGAGDRRAGADRRARLSTGRTVRGMGDDPGRLGRPTARARGRRCGGDWAWRSWGSRR